MYHDSYGHIGYGYDGNQKAGTGDIKRQLVGSISAISSCCAKIDSFLISVSDILIASSNKIAET